MYNSNENKDSIEQVKDTLYSRSVDGVFIKKRHSLQDQTGSKIPTSWNLEEEQQESNYEIPYTKILLGAFVFFIFALGFTFSKFFLGSNIVSGNNIDILVSGSASIAGGEELPLEIEVINNNNIDLKTVDLRIEYPAGTKSAQNHTVDLPRYSEVLGNINVGKSEKRIVNSVIYGEENSTKVIKIKVEYRVAGSNAIFSKQKDFDILISSSPVNIKVSNPKEINTNQLVDFSIDINSNSTTIVKNLILKVDYPFGFNFSASNPKSVNADGTVYSIGDLSPGAKRNIKISGTVTGQDGEERVLKFTIGIPDKDDNTIVGTPLAVYMSTLSLKKSSIALDVSVNDESGKEIAITTGRKNRVNISWKNNLPDNIYDMAVKINLSSQVLDKNSITTENGFYNSNENSIIFDKSYDESLSMIRPDEEGGVRFDFSTFNFSSKTMSLFGDSSVRFDISVLGSRNEFGGSNNQEVLYYDTKILKLSSSLKLLSRGYRTFGPFENSGPFPPQADNETTYTIIWTATNSFNSITGAKVSAFLPPNVKWTGYTSPNSEKITYDQGTGEIVWNIGDMKSGLGTNSPAKEVSFQVAITPSITQIGSELNLLNQATISGIDAYSQARLGEVKSPVTTNITSDPEYVDNIGKVVPATID